MAIHLRANQSALISLRRLAENEISGFFGLLLPSELPAGCHPEVCQAMLEYSSRSS